MSAESILAAVNEAYAAGLAVIPPKQDGSKAPDVTTWTRYQVKRPTAEELQGWYANGRTGIGVLAGQTSGGLEMLEFEGRAVEAGISKAFLRLAAEMGLGDVVERIRAGYQERTPSGGIHLLYRVPTPLGNTKLASRPAAADEIAADPETKSKVLIETRGEGGYVVTAPSNGHCHETGRPWVIESGGFDTIAAITGDERDRLFDVARMLDEMPLAEVRPPRATTPLGVGDDERPGDRYNALPDPEGRMEDLLTGHGWQVVYRHAGITYLRRPGKDRGISASLGRYPGMFIVFSTSTEFKATSTDDPKGYLPFSVYTILEHGGKFKAAAAALEPPIRINGTRPGTGGSETGGEDDPQPDTTALPDLRDVFESLQDTTEYPFLVDRMLRLGYFALLAAYESTGKSYIGTQVALSVITRRSVFGEFAVNEAMGVCVFDMEMGEAEDRNRDRQMLADMGIEPDTVKGLYRRITLDDASLSLKNDAHVEYIGTQLDKAHDEMGRPILAILDSTDSMVGKRPWGEDAETLDRAISKLREGRRAWLVILLLCHTKKRPSEGKADYVRDLEDVLGNLTRQADMAMVLDLKGSLALRCGIYKRPGRSSGILQRDEGGYAWTWTTDIGEAGGTKVSLDDVYASLLVACGESKVGRTTAWVMADRLKVALNTAKGYLGKLEAAGRITSTVQGTDRGRVEFWPAGSGE